MNLLFALSSGGYAQSASHQFQLDDYSLEVSLWGTEDGLPSWFITDLLEDKLGYVWLASPTGLVKFDGKEFTNYGSRSYGFRHRAVTQLAQDVNGNIWTFQNFHDSIFIEVFDPIREYAIPIEDYIGESLSLSRLYYDGIFNMDEQQLWILDPIKQYGGYYDGDWHWVLKDSARLLEQPYAYYHPKEDSTFWRIDVLTEGSRIRHIDRNGQWLGEEINAGDDYRPAKELIAGNPSFYKRGADNSRIEDDTILYVTDIGGLQSIPLLSLHKLTKPYAFYRSGSRFIFSETGFGMQRKGRNMIISYKGEVLTSDLGEALLDVFQTEVKDQFFSTRDGAIWFRSEKGLFRCTLNPKLFKAYQKEGSPPMSFRGIGLLNDSTVIANTYKRTSTIDLSTGDFTTVGFERNNLGKGLLVEEDTIWVSQHYISLTALARESLKPLEYHAIDPLFPGYDGQQLYRLKDTLLVGSQIGLLHLLPGDDKLRQRALIDTLVQCFYSDADGLWLGTDNGLSLLDENGFLVRHYPIVNEWGAPVQISDIHKDKAGVFWLATKEGLARWHMEEEEQPYWYKLGEGLSNETLHAVYEDSHENLWLPSNYGLMRFHKATGTVYTYFEQDGLPDNEFNSMAHYRSEDGRLFLGTVNGLCVFHPDSLIAAEQLDIILGIGKVTVFSRETEEQRDCTQEVGKLKTLALQADENRLIIELTPNFLKKGQMVYQWRIPQYGQQWRTLTGQSLELSNLPYGEATVAFRVFPVGNLDSMQELRLRLLVLRPFYLQWWFFVSVGIAVFVAIWQVLQWRDRRLLKANMHLQAKVAQATAELRQLDQLKSRFFANVSHELRTPLSLILGPLSRLLDSKNIGEEERREVLRIERNAKQIQTLTEEILDLKRLEAGKMQLEPSTVDIRQCLKRWFAAFVSLADYKEIRYDLFLDMPGPIWVNADIAKIERIVNNLLGNALKFCTVGDEVIMSAHWQSSAARILITIADSGPGIPAQEVEHIFDRYYQTNQTTQKLQGGLGIGLSMSKELALLMDGQLWAESTLGEGTTMYLQLPMITTAVPAQQAAIEEMASASKQLTETVDAAAKNATKILLVEDNEDLLQFIQEQLSPHFQVIQARDGKEALQVLYTESIDLIISDVMMPKTDGFKLLHEVRKTTVYQHLPFILLTARTSKEDRLKGLRLGVDSYLQKPFLPEELLARVRNLLANQRQRQQSLQQLPDVIMASRDVQNAFDENWLMELENTLKTVYQEPKLKVSTLAKAMNISERTLRTKLKQYTGLSPNQYILRYRLNVAFQALENRSYSTIAELCYAVGFNNASYFSKLFREEFGKAPSDYLSDEV